MKAFGRNILKILGLCEYLFSLYSGVIISYNYLNYFQSLNKMMMVKFIRKRVYKIWIYHILILFLSLPFMFKLNMMDNLIKLIFNITLTQS